MWVTQAAKDTASQRTPHTARSPRKPLKRSLQRLYSLWESQYGTSPRLPHAVWHAEHSAMHRLCVREFKTTRIVIAVCRRLLRIPI